MEKQYYIIYNGRQEGPMPVSELFNYGLNAHSYVWCEGMPQWAEAYTVAELMGAINANNSSVPGSEGTGATPPDPINIGNPDIYQKPSQPQPPICPTSAQSDKSNIAFGVLALVIGTLGLQYFYVGKTTAGIICILLTLASCGLWSLVSFIQGIAVIFMSQADFERKFVYSESTFPIL